MNFRIPLLLFVAVLCLFVVMKRSGGRLTPAAMAKQKIEAAGEFSKAAFWKYVSEGETSIVKLYLTAGMSPDTHFGETPALGLATAKGHVEIVRELIAAGADVNVRLRHGETPLMLAARLHGFRHNPERAGRQYQIAEMLVKAGADVNATDLRGVSAISLAQDSQATDMVALLSTAGAKDPHAMLAQSRGELDLMQAARTGDLPGVQRALGSGARVNCVDQNKRTALMLAAENGFDVPVQYLASSGAELNVRDASGQTALMLAARRGHMKAVETLVLSGAQLNLRDPSGRTAMKLASHAGQPEIAGYLKLQGAEE